MIPCHPYPGKWLVWRCPVKSHDRLHPKIPPLMVLPYRHPNSENVILQDLTPIMHDPNYVWYHPLYIGVSGYSEFAGKN